VLVVDGHWGYRFGMRAGDATTRVERPLVLEHMFE
jgi:hypothetical protein